MAKKETWKMHFYKGKPCRWDGDEYDKETDKKEFEADLCLIDYERGCSSTVLILVPYKDKDKDYFDKKLVKYQVFASDMVEMIYHMNKCRVKGTFRFVKKGANYGIKLIKAEET